MVIPNLPVRAALNVVTLERAREVGTVSTFKNRIDGLLVEGRNIVDMKCESADVLVFVYRELVARINLKGAVVKGTTMPEVKSPRRGSAET